MYMFIAEIGYFGFTRSHCDTPEMRIYNIYSKILHHTSHVKTSDVDTFFQWVFEYINYDS